MFLCLAKNINYYLSNGNFWSSFVSEAQFDILASVSLTQLEKWCINSKHCKGQNYAKIMPIAKRWYIIIMCFIDAVIMHNLLSSPRATKLDNTNQILHRVHKLFFIFSLLKRLINCILVFCNILINFRNICV